MYSKVSSPISFLVIIFNIKARILVTGGTAGETSMGFSQFL